LQSNFASSIDRFTDRLLSCDGEIQPAPPASAARSFVPGGQDAIQAARNSPSRPALLRSLRQIYAGLWSNVRFLWSIALAVYALAIIHAIRRLWQPDGLLGDFATFRNAAIALSQGGDIYAGASNEYVYLPLIAFLFQPFGWISLRAAGAVSLTINLGLSLMTLRLGSLEISRRLLGHTNALVVARIAAIAAVLSSDKIHAEFNLWETNTLMLFLFTVALTLADRRQWLAGTALGIAFNIKYLPLTFLPYLILRRRLRLAASFVSAAILFAILPAVSLGWSGNLRALASAYSGLAGLIGIHVGHAAHVFPMTDWRTFSVTSAIARFTNWPAKLVLLMSGAMALTVLAAAAMVYRFNHLPIVRWPAASGQRTVPWHALFAIEWVVVILLTLIFSPFTNAAHFYLILPANIAGATLLTSMRRPTNRPLIIGTAFMCAGILYPPGGDIFRQAEQTSKWFSLPAWCLLVFCGSLLWSAARQLRTPRHRVAAPDQTAPACL
jgi:hypothetical protein